MGCRNCESTGVCKLATRMAEMKVKSEGVVSYYWSYEPWIRILADKRFNELWVGPKLQVERPKGMYRLDAVQGFVYLCGMKGFEESCPTSQLGLEDLAIVARGS